MYCRTIGVISDGPRSPSFAQFTVMVKSYCQVEGQVRNISQAVSLNHGVQKFSGILRANGFYAFNQFVQRKVIDAVNVTSSETK
jgi:hypothetical protein